MSPYTTNTYITKGSLTTMNENTKNNIIEIDKTLYSSYLSFIKDSNSKDIKAELAAEIGLIKIWTYHCNCNRCNYTWIPKDFDFNGNNDILFDIEPPKSCARCKSKYWNKTPQRETNFDKGLHSVARLRALSRRQDQFEILENKA